MENILILSYLSTLLVTSSNHTNNNNNIEATNATIPVSGPSFTTPPPSKVFKNIANRSKEKLSNTLFSTFDKSQMTTRNSSVRFGFT